VQHANSAPVIPAASIFDACGMESSDSSHHDGLTPKTPKTPGSSSEENAQEDSERQEEVASAQVEKKAKW
jgi:hypothetical protein